MQNDDTTYFGDDAPSPQTAQVMAHLGALFGKVEASLNARPMNLEAVRAAGERWPIAPSMPDGQFTVRPVSTGSVSGEWVVAEGAALERRILILHGGGYVMGSPETYRPLAAVISRATGCAVLSLRYRLAPEFTVPAQLDDALAGFAYMRANGPQGPADTAMTFVLGASAGGALALSLVVALRDRGAALPDALVMIAPWADLRGSEAEVEMTKGTAPVMARLFLGDTPADAPLASPVLADLRGLPAMLLHSSTGDFLIEQNLRLAQSARTAGVEVRTEIWRHMPHVWHQMRPLLPEADAALDRIGVFLREAITKRGRSAAA